MMEYVCPVCCNLLNAEGLSWWCVECQERVEFPEYVEVPTKVDWKYCTQEIKLPVTPELQKMLNECYNLELDRIVREMVTPVWQPAVDFWNGKQWDGGTKIAIPIEYTKPPFAPGKQVVHLW